MTKDPPLSDAFAGILVTITSPTSGESLMSALDLARWQFGMVVVPDNNPFTSVEGDPDAATRAAKANTQPTLTQISANHDLAWTTTVWTGTGS